MTLDGFYFAATGVSSYAFFHSDLCVARTTRSALPQDSVRVYAGERWWSFPPLKDGTPGAGASFPFCETGGKETGRLYLLGPDRFGIAIEGASLIGRVIHSRARRSVLYAGLDDRELLMIECDFNRNIAREEYGEWFPRQYVATIMGVMDESLLAMALSAPFLNLSALEID